MASKRWSEVVTTKFVKLYEEAECLWNFRHPLYKNKNARATAEENIVKKMEIPEFTVTELKNKIKNIRSTYVQEKTKLKKAIHSGMAPEETYQSHLVWFNIADRFLGRVITTRETFSNCVSSVLLYFNIYNMLINGFKAID